MMLLDAIEMYPRCVQTPRRRDGRLEYFLTLLSALPESEHPYAYLMATEPPKPRMPGS